MFKVFVVFVWQRFKLNSKRKLRKIALKYEKFHVIKIQKVWEHKHETVIKRFKTCSAKPMHYAGLSQANARTNFNSLMKSIIAFKISE